jgi:hypothetical protein
MRITPGNNRIIFDKSFSSFGLLSEDEVCDFVDMFFNYDDTNVTWTIMNVDKGVDFNGQHMYNPNTREHTITFSKKNIAKNYCKGRRDFGGNLKLPDIDMKAAAALVLAHELQHANQSKLHKGNELFYGNLGGLDSRGKPRMKHYRGRACERDAREFVDGHLNEIFAYFNLPPPRRNKVFVPEDSDELVEVADLLCECAEITFEDIRDELRASRILNPRNMQRMLEILRTRGVIP